MASQASLKRARDFVDFLNASPNPFHAVRSCKERLEKAGFSQLQERQSWTSVCRPGGKYYVTRNASTIVAFAIGSAWKPGNPIGMVGSHTDSCCLRLKPVSKRSADGYLQVGVEVYGGGLWNTWFDRDLGVAGRVMVQRKDGAMEQKLVRLDRPIFRIPNLAVHFGQSEPFTFNKETHLFPIAGLVSAEANRSGKTGENAHQADATDGKFSPLETPLQRHHPYLVELIAAEASCTPEEVLDFELSLYDVQPACIGGINNELIYSARLDNLGMTYCAVEGLIQSLDSPAALQDDPTIRLIACFDNEEVGSTTAQGAYSTMLPLVIRRLSTLPSSSSEGSEKSYDKLSNGEADSSTAYEQTLATSFLVSADMAHAVNPNYPAIHESSHRPHMNEGTVIKINANQKYATNSPGIVLIQECARRAKPATWQNPLANSQAQEGKRKGVPLQLFVSRNDIRCGTTIGPLLAAGLGTRTIDVGNAQLAMHSIREVGGAYDPEHGVNLFDSFFQHYGELESKILVD